MSAVVPSLPTPPCLAHSMHSTNICGMNTWKLQDSRALSPKPSEWKIYQDTMARHICKRSCFPTPHFITPQCVEGAALSGPVSLLSTGLGAWLPKQEAAAMPSPLPTSLLFRMQACWSYSVSEEQWNSWTHCSRRGAQILHISKYRKNSPLIKIR